MSTTIPIAQPDAGRAPGAGTARRFPASTGRFDSAADRTVFDALVQWVEDTYREDLRQRPSKHVYVDKLPAAVVRQIDMLRDSTVIRDAILQHVPAGSVVCPMKHTDELYLSHYNKDYGGDQGLYSKHYDGNLRFLPWCPVVRALIYLQSDATYTVVFGDSGVRNTLVSRSTAPPKGSTSTGSGVVSSRAIALTVKSRRDRSISMSSAYDTSGLRESELYTSARCVVIS